MPRIRTVKPEFWLNEDLAEQPSDTRLLALGLLNQADDEGYFKANPAILKGAIFPLSETSVSVQVMLTQLSKIGYIKIYNGSDSRQYGHVVNFVKHQVVNRPSASKIKQLINFSEESVNYHGEVTDHSLEERKGKEQGKEEEGKGNSRSHLLTWFDCLWDSFDSAYGDKGAKKAALAQFKKINPDQQLFDEIMSGLNAQLSEKRMKQSAAVFYPPFQHVERWLKNRRWEDEVSNRIINQRDTRDKAAIAADAAFGADFDDSVFEGECYGVDADGVLDQPDAGNLPNLGARLVRPY